MKFRLIRSFLCVAVLCSSGFGQAADVFERMKIGPSGAGTNLV